MKWLKQLFSAEVEIGIAASMLASSLILWPISQLTFAKVEPPVTLAISWLALSYAAFTALIAAQNRKEK